MGTVSIAEDAGEGQGQRPRRKCCSALEQQWQVEARRGLPAVRRFNAVDQPMASEKPRAALPGTPWHAVAPIISSILSQHLLVDQIMNPIMNISKSYVKIKNETNLASAMETLHSCLHVCNVRVPVICAIADAPVDERRVASRVCI